MKSCQARQARVAAACATIPSPLRTLTRRRCMQSKYALHWRTAPERLMRSNFTVALWNLRLRSRLYCVYSSHCPHARCQQLLVKNFMARIALRFSCRVSSSAHRQDSNAGATTKLKHLRAHCVSTCFSWRCSQVACAHWSTARARAAARVLPVARCSRLRARRPHAAYSAQLAKQAPAEPRITLATIRPTTSFSCLYACTPSTNWFQL
mmetsp:Transcript_10860/g.20664  ORF Transcript_10860/g.20664 Transcript_10860/m.20664 type:complete len:208 (+) Transcript_10860:126-749(+)